MSKTTDVLFIPNSGLTPLYYYIYNGLTKSFTRVIEKVGDDSPPTISVN